MSRDALGQPGAPDERRGAAVYAAEAAAVAAVPLRRFRRFAHVEDYVQGLVLSQWWAEEFDGAPLEVELQRRSRNATASLAATTDDGIGLVALVDGRGWGLETVLHELAHLAAGAGGHGPAFTDALERLWRHEAGVEAWAVLRSELGLRAP